MDAKCDYCEQDGVQVDCLGNVCCAECWEDMKDWTLEKEEAQRKLTKELCERIGKNVAEIKIENGLSPDSPGAVCTSCRKMIQSDEHGNWYCDCHDERVGIDPNAPDVMPIPERFLKKF